MPKNTRVEQRSIITTCADFLTKAFGTVWFFMLHVVVFLGWILINMDILPFLPAFDPYPYGLLTTVVSLEAIFLSIIVLMSQNRASDLADIREELDLEINIKAENEITRIINMLDEIHDHLGLTPEDDPELQEMKKKTNINDVKKKLIKMRNTQ
ncbi:MAG: DUF1003 domain-containing protein [Candidatus Magasanikbacteria bacterium]|nr:DUF1003 domain-containing protein [Candidatus Magasanikbacteria bacterium]